MQEARMSTKKAMALEGNSIRWLSTPMRHWILFIVCVYVWEGKGRPSRSEVFPCK